MNFVNHRVKLKESEKDKYLNLARELKKTTTEGHESDVYTNCNCSFWYIYRRINQETGGLGNKRTNEDHPNYCINEIAQNIQKSPVDLRRLAVTHNTVKDNQQTLM